MMCSFSVIETGTCTPERAASGVPAKEAFVAIEALMNVAGDVCSDREYRYVTHLQANTKERIGARLISVGSAERSLIG